MRISYTPEQEELRRELYERRRWGSQSDGAPLRTPMSTLATF